MILAAFSAIEAVTRNVWKIQAWTASRTLTLPILRNKSFN